MEIRLSSFKIFILHTVGASGLQTFHLRWKERGREERQREEDRERERGMCVSILHCREMDN